MRKLIFTFALCLLVPHFSKADILLEPYIGYELGNYNFVKTPASVVGVIQSGTLNGFAGGLKIAYLLNIPFIGIDFNYASLTDKSSNATVNATRTVLYGILGIDLPMDLMIYGGYAPINSLNSLNTTVNSVPVTHNGTAYKIGASYGIFKPIHLGLEYIVYNSLTFNCPAGNFTTSNEYGTSTYSAWVLNISAPFTF